MIATDCIQFMNCSVY